MLKFMKSVICSLLIATCLVGCLFYDNPTVNYYDLNSVQGDVFTVNSEIAYPQIRNITPVGVNFLYSNSNGQIIIDRENNWIQTPELMIRRKFITAIQPEQAVVESSEVKKLNIYISLFAMEMNKDRQESLVGITTKITCKDENLSFETEKQYVQTVKVTENTSAGFAKASAVAMNMIINNVVEDLDKLDKINIDRK